MSAEITVTDDVSPHRAEVLQLVEEARQVDGVSPLDEQSTIGLYSGAPAQHFLAFATAKMSDSATAKMSDSVRTKMSDSATAKMSYSAVVGELAGYARLADESVDLAVRPKYRHHGLGSAIVGKVFEVAGQTPIRFWAHGPHEDAARIASSYEMKKVRELWRMRRPLDQELPDFPVPKGVSVRTFRPGEDEEAVVAVNAAAFADHPEQGRLTVDDLRVRMAKPWFDPEGFFVAEVENRVVGFHWTKVHGPPVRGEDPGHRVGEIYVLGVTPNAHAHGLGKVLTVVGLRYFVAKGLPVAMLFTEADNGKAIHLYEKIGFEHVDTDVMYARNLVR